jgi:hypothetical protein
MRASALAQNSRLQTTAEPPPRLLTESLRRGRLGGRGIRSLLDAWERRSEPAEAALSPNRHLRRLVREATATELLTLVDEALSARSAAAEDGPNMATLYPLVDYLSFYGDAEALELLRARFDARGPAWAMVSSFLAHTWAIDMMCD